MGFDFWNKDKKKNKKEKAYSASSYWYDEYDSDYDAYDYDDSRDDVWVAKDKATKDLYKLASVRRAISNFVNIVTSKSIKVVYHQKNSYTNGESVVLASNVGDNFDVSVGLALHEGSHILLSDFDQLKIYADCAMYGLKYINIPVKDTDRISYDREMLLNMESVIKIVNNDNTKRDSTFAVDGKRNNYGIREKKILMKIVLSNGLFKHIFDKGLNFRKVVEELKGLTNWIEDRRIDQFIYTTAPGYREYYKSMYAHYFEDRIITKGIESDSLTDETIDSYMFRIVNITNPKTDLNKLKGLKEISKLLDLAHISRLKDSWDSLELSSKVMEIVLSNLPSEAPFKKQTANAGEGEESNEGEESKESGESAEGGEPTDSKSDGKGEQSVPKNGKSDFEDGSGNSADDNDDDSNNGQSVSLPEGVDADSIEATNSKSDGGANDKSLLSKKDLDKLIKKIQKQGEFVNGNIKKKGLSKQEAKSLEAVEESGSEIVHVGDGYKQEKTWNADYNSTYQADKKGIDCIVVKYVTDALLNDFGQWPYHFSEGIHSTEVAAGMNLGTLLGNKLQIRSESRETVFNRLKKGRIDQRMIATLGFDNEGVFYTKEIDQFKKVNLHISLDYSGSMGGRKLSKAITCTVAIAKACLMARNVNVVVSIRSTSHSGGRNSKPLPHIAVIYDSKKDNIKRLNKLIGGMYSGNTTPEGLCFEAIMDKLIPASNDTESYFLNMSDGEPTFESSDYHYYGEGAAKHTHAQIKKMHEKGIHTLSYFITDSGRDDAAIERSSAWDIFKKCYGVDAKHIDTSNLQQIAITMNQLFLKKSK